MVDVHGQKDMLRLLSEKEQIAAKPSTQGIEKIIADIWTTGMGGIVVIAPEGKVIASLKLSGASNLCFGGADGKTTRPPGLG